MALNQNNQSNLIKLQFNNEVRRFRIENDEFENFKMVISSILNVNPNEYEYTYVDSEGDQITFSSQVEFAYAVSNGNPLRITMKKRNEGGNEGALREMICEVEKKSTEELKTKIKEINQKIRATKEQMKDVKMQKKQRKGDIKSGYFEEMSEEDKNDRLALFQLDLSLYELKLIKRSLFVQFKSQNKCQRREEFDSNNNNTTREMKNHREEFAQLRQSVWELKEKAKVIKVQIRSVKLLMNSNNSETQKAELQKQLNTLKSQLVQLNEEKFQLCSQFRQQRRSNNNNINDEGNCKRKWKMEMSEDEREQRRAEFKLRRSQMIDIKKRIIQIKSIKDFQKNDELVQEIKLLKGQMQLLKETQKACWKRHQRNLAETS